MKSIFLVCKDKNCNGENPECQCKIRYAYARAEKLLYGRGGGNARSFCNGIPKPLYRGRN